MLQHLWVVQGGIDKKGMFDGILYHFSHGLVEHNISHLYAKIFRVDLLKTMLVISMLMKMSLQAGEN
jgi:hypothetical protein